MALIADSILLAAFVNYDPGPIILLGSGLAVAIFTLVAKRLPANLFRSNQVNGPTHSPRTYGIYGILLFPLTLLTGGIAAGTNIPAIIPIIVDFICTYFILTRTIKSIGTINNQEHKTAFGIGLLIPVVVFGIFAGFGIGNFLVLAGDLLFVLFSRRLWQKWHYWTIMQRFTVQQPTLQGLVKGP
jgi:hypothetical protein